MILHGEEEGGGRARRGDQGASRSPRVRRPDYSRRSAARERQADHLLRRPRRAGVDVTVTRQRARCNSGNYGNWMPDANVRPSQLPPRWSNHQAASPSPASTTMCRRSPAADVAMMRAVPDNTAAMKRAYGIGSTDGQRARSGRTQPSSFSTHDEGRRGRRRHRCECIG